MVTHTKPWYSAKGMGMLSRQKYAFPNDPRDGSEAWDRVLEILCEDMAFHELMAKFDLKVILNPDWKITFKNTGGKVDGPRYSRVMKALWDNFKPLFEDYGLRLKNRHTGDWVK